MRNDGEGQGQTTRGLEKLDPPIVPETLNGNVRLPKPGDFQENARSSSDWPHIFPYFIPIPISLALIVILAVLDVKLVFDPPGLLLVLNTCFLSLLPFLVAFIAMKGYLSSGSISLIMLAAGCLSLGLGSILAGFMPLTHLGVNGVVAIHNFSALLSSVFQVLGVASALVGLPPQQDRRLKKLYVMSLFLGISGFAALLTITSVYGVGPVFFVQGSGPTPLRQTVLGFATAMFLVSGLLLGAMYLRSGSRFLFFYCMALFLIAEGLFCISIQKAVGSPIGWLGRGLQYLAGIYLLVAILEARSELVVRGLRLDVGIAQLLRHHLEPLVEQRTEELALTNEELRQENMERVRVQEALKKANDELEVRVRERTWELVTTVEALQKEVATRKEAEEGLRRTARALKALSDCNQALIRATEESSLLDEICRVIVEIGGYLAAWVGFSQDDELKTVRLVAQWGFQERDAEKFDIRWADIEQGRGPTGTAIRTGTVFLLRSAANDQASAIWQDEIKKYGIGSVIAFPLLVEGQVIGAMTIAAPKADAFDDEEMKLLEELAGDLAYGIETLRTRVAHRQAEESAERANREWERTFNAISDLIMVLNNEYQIIRANKAMADALGITEQEMIGKVCFEVILGTKEPPPFCPHSQLLADGEEHSAEVVEPRLGGIYDVRVSPLFGQDGQVIGSVHINRDITSRKKMEEALSQSESMLRGVLKAAPIGIGVVSDRIIQWTNEFVFKMTGYAQEELMGQSARILYEDDEEFERVGAVKYAEIRKTGTGTTETRWKRKDGTIIDIILSSTSIDPENLSAGVVFTALDATERKQAQQGLLESEQRYRAVFDNAGIGIDVVDNDGRVVRVNPALSKMLGYSEEDFRQISLTEITHPDEREISKQSLDRILSGEVPSYRLEKRYIRKDGGIVWGDLSVSAIRDAEGKHTATVGVIADITERKESQVKLKQSEERLRLIIDSSPIGIIIVQDGKYVYVNPRFVEIFGYEKADEILGLPVEAIYVPDSKELIVQRVPDSASGTKTISHYEAVGVSKTGKRIDAGAWVTEIEYLGEEASLAFVMDMTESNSLRSQFLQAQKMEAIGTLAGGIAHDFNNLLTVILGYSEILVSEKGKKDRDYEDLKKIMYAGRTAADMVQQILAFSRKAETKARPINLNKQVKQLQKMVSRLIPRTIEVRINLDPDPPPVNADPSQMDQVLMNLAVNARDAMPDGGRLTIETKTIVLDDDYCRSHIEAAEGLHVLLMVTDTGVGIDKTLVGRIFEPYYTTKKPGEGTGLGLATVYGIVKGHGGHITCYSESGVGTTFKIYLPVHRIGMEPDVEISQEFPVFGTGTVLLVDDEEFVRSLGQRILEKSGYRVITASNGGDAVEIYKQRKDEISLIILDLIMPVMDGRRCLGEILRIDPGAKVLIASGYSPDGTTRETLAGGAKGFVGKPYNLRELLKTVRSVLNGE